METGPVPTLLCRVWKNDPGERMDAEAQLKKVLAEQEAQRAAMEAERAVWASWSEAVEVLSPALPPKVSGDSPSERSAHRAGMLARAARHGCPFMANLVSSGARRPDGLLADHMLLSCEIPLAPIEGARAEYSIQIRNRWDPSKPFPAFGPLSRLMHPAVEGGLRWHLGWVPSLHCALFLPARAAAIPHDPTDPAEACRLHSMNDAPAIPILMRPGEAQPALLEAFRNSAADLEEEGSILLWAKEGGRLGAESAEADENARRFCKGAVLSDSEAAGPSSDRDALWLRRSSGAVFLISQRPGRHHLESRVEMAFPI